MPRCYVPSVPIFLGVVVSALGMRIPLVPAQFALQGQRLQLKTKPPLGCGTIGDPTGGVGVGGQGFFRIIKNQRGGDPSPKTPSPPPQTKVTIVGKNEIYNRENLVRPFLVHQVLGPKPPPPLPPATQKKPWGGGAGASPPPPPFHAVTARSLAGPPLPTTVPYQREDNEWVCDSTQRTPPRIQRCHRAGAPQQTPTALSWHRQSALVPVAASVAGRCLACVCRRHRSDGLCPCGAGVLVFLGMRRGGGGACGARGGTGHLGRTETQRGRLWTACGQRRVDGKYSQTTPATTSTSSILNYWAPLTRKRHIPPHPAQPRHTKYWAPRTRKQHQQEHRPQRPSERSDPTQHAKGRTGDCPGPRKETTTRRHVTRGAGLTHGPSLHPLPLCRRCHEGEGPARGWLQRRRVRERRRVGHPNRLQRGLGPDGLRYRDCHPHGHHCPGLVHRLSLCISHIVCLPAHLPLCLSVCLPVCLSVCLSAPCQPADEELTQDGGPATAAGIGGRGGGGQRSAMLRPRCAANYGGALLCWWHHPGRGTQRPSDLTGHRRDAHSPQTPTCPRLPPPPPDIPSGYSFFAGPQTVTQSPLQVLRRVAAF